MQVVSRGQPRLFSLHKIVCISLNLRSIRWHIFCDVLYQKDHDEIHSFIYLSCFFLSKGIAEYVS